MINHVRSATHHDHGILPITSVFPPEGFPQKAKLVWNKDYPCGMPLDEAGDEQRLRSPA